jgi:hypothetical protein
MKARAGSPPVDSSCAANLLRADPHVVEPHVRQGGDRVVLDDADRVGPSPNSRLPRSMAAALIGMNLFGVTGDLMLLGAIDFGFLVDEL